MLTEKVDKTFAHLLKSSRKFNKFRCRDPQCMGFDFAKRQVQSIQPDVADESKRLLDSPPDVYSTPILEQANRKKLRMDPSLVKPMNFEKNVALDGISKQALIPDTRQNSIASNLYNVVVSPLVTLIADTKTEEEKEKGERK